MKKTVSNKFEKEYFAGYYHPNVGNFAVADLQKSINWFTGWFNYLQKYVDFRNGKWKCVLEVGCSIGGASCVLADRGFNVYAADISSYAVTRAKQLARKVKRKIEFTVFDVQKKIPLKKEFDIIIAFEVIEHLEDPLTAIRNMRDKLKLGGCLICSTPNGENDVYYDPTHINVKPAVAWKEIFKKAGFSSVTTSQVAFLPYFYKFSARFHLVLPIAIYSRLINSPLFVIAKN